MNIKPHARPYFEPEVDWRVQKHLKLAGWLLAALAVLTALALFQGKAEDVFGVSHWATRTLARSFRFRGEGTVPAWFNTGLLWTAGWMLAAVANKRRGLGLKRVLPWAGFAVLFFYLSADEMLAWHEMTTPAAEEWVEPTGVFRLAWVVFGMVFVAVIGLVALPWLIRLPPATRGVMIASGVIFVSGAIGCEMISGPFRPVEGSGDSWMIYEILQILEEDLEMVGVICFIYAIGSYTSALSLPISDVTRTPPVPAA